MTHVNVKLTLGMKKTFANEELDLAIEDALLALDRGQRIDNKALEASLARSKGFLAQDIEHSLVHISTTIDVLHEGGLVQEAEALEKEYWRLMEALDSLRK